MKRWIAAGSVMVAALALSAGPASAQPQGQGLVDFGVATCEGVGEVSVFGPRGEGAATAFATTGQHVVVVDFTISGTDPEGQPFTFSKSFGEKAGLTTFTCTQHFEEPGEGTADLTVVVALVPPQ
jgi:hypothetical protein